MKITGTCDLIVTVAAHGEWSKIDIAGLDISIVDSCDVIRRSSRLIAWTQPVYAGQRLSSSKHLREQVVNLLGGLCGVVNIDSQSYSLPSVYSQSECLFLGRLTA